jgi:hypothetical protein
MIGIILIDLAPDPYTDERIKYEFVFGELPAD